MSFKKRIAAFTAVAALVLPGISPAQTNAQTVSNQGTPLDPKFSLQVYTDDVSNQPSGQVATFAYANGQFLVNDKVVVPTYSCFASLDIPQPVWSSGSFAVVTSTVPVEMMGWKANEVLMRLGGTNAHINIETIGVAGNYWRTDDWNDLFKVVRVPVMNMIVLPPVYAPLYGRMWYDLNRNGQQDAEELHVQRPGPDGQVVELYQYVPEIKNSAVLVTSTKTVDGGYYNFSAIAGQNYVVKFTSPKGYTWTISNFVTDTIDSDVSLMDGTSMGVYLTTTTALDAGLVEPTVVISDAVNSTGYTMTLIYSPPTLYPSQRIAVTLLDRQVSVASLKGNTCQQLTCTATIALPENWSVIHTGVESTTVESAYALQFPLGGNVVRKPIAQPPVTTTVVYLPMVINSCTASPGAKCDE